LRRQQFAGIPAAHPVQWLSDNGAIFAAHRTIEIALALNLVPCFTPVESPESNGVAEAFVKTFKRDYVRVGLIPDAATALVLVDSWMEDYNTVHPHSRLATAHLGSTFFPNPSRVRLNGVNSTSAAFQACRNTHSRTKYLFSKSRVGTAQCSSN
jgi:transposase InsO family protein